MNQYTPTCGNIPEELQSLMQIKTEESLQVRHRLMEELAAAFCLKMNLPPEEVCLCEWSFSDGTIRWWFERRNPS